MGAGLADGVLMDVAALVHTRLLEPLIPEVSRLLQGGVAPWSKTVLKRLWFWGPAAKGKLSLVARPQGALPQPGCGTTSSKHRPDRV